MLSRPTVCFVLCEIQCKRLKRKKFAERRAARGFSAAQKLHDVVHAAAVKCPTVVFRVVSSKGTAVGTALNVSCPAGQKLTNGHNVTTTFCTRLGYWIPEIPRCVGELLMYR